MPQPFDVLWCRFPTRERPSEPGPKARPCLVVAVGEKGDGLVVAAAYGTSQSHGTPPAWQVSIDLIPGTSTQFDLSRVVAMSFTSAYFPAKPKLGVWPESRRAELRAAAKAARR